MPLGNPHTRLLMNEGLLFKFSSITVSLVSVANVRQSAFWM